MLKTILLPKSLHNEIFDGAHPLDFKNGKFISEYTVDTNFWIETTLPAVPSQGSHIYIEGIEKQEMFRQLSECYKKVEGFRDLLCQYRERHKEYIKDASTEEVLKHLSGFGDKIISVYGGHWYVDSVSLRANDEYLYVCIHNEI